MAAREVSVRRLVVAKYFPDVLVAHSFRSRWHIEAVLAGDRLESEHVRVPGPKDVFRLQVFFLVFHVIVGHGDSFREERPPLCGRPCDDTPSALRRPCVALLSVPASTPSNGLRLHSAPSSARHAPTAPREWRHVSGAP
jgi:hypothetical protein